MNNQVRAIARLDFTGRESTPEIENLRISTIRCSTVDDVLTAFRGNITQSAEALGINRGTLRKIAERRRPNVVLINEFNGEFTYTLLK